MSEFNDLIKIEANVLKKINNHALKGYNENKSEVIGYLIGIFKENSIEIKDIIIPDQIASSYHAEITDERALINYIENNKSNYVHVGWYHSHPNIGCFLSNIDIPTQKYWQHINNRMIALVIDPINNELKVFRLNNKDQTYELPIKKI